jgi:hypothetical protein
LPQYAGEPLLRYGIASAAAAAIPHGLLVENIPSFDPVLTQPLDRIDGYVAPSETPGSEIPFASARLREFPSGR